MAYRQPSPPPPLNDISLEDVFQQAVAGITGIDTNLVRPRLQPTVPNYPDFSVDWVALGVQTVDQDNFAHSQHRGSLEHPDESRTTVSRDELLELFLSFYGPNCHESMSRMREGLMLAENRAELAKVGIQVGRIGKPQLLPALLKERWVKRVDIKLYFTRRVTRTYQENTIATADVTIDTEDGRITHINVTNQ